MSMEMVTPGALLQDVMAIARLAGEKIMAVYETDFVVTDKDDRSPLTAADLAAHRCIVAGLNRLTPQLPVLSEEAADIPYKERAEWCHYWLVDPLDGTREFIKRNGDFTVNIALIDKQRVVLGVVYVPVTGVCYFASHGDGAYKQVGSAAPQRIQVRSWNGGSCTVVGSRSHRGDSLDNFLAQLGEYEILSIGSSLKLCLVAEGQADVYLRLGLTSEWDTAAAQGVVEEAGGQVTDTAMQRLLYNTKDTMLNPHFFAFGDSRQNWAQLLG